MVETKVRHAEVFDAALALSSVGGDREFLAELVGLTQAAWPTLLTNIQAGLNRGDLCAVEATARLAKAAARNISAERAYESALRLEAMARKGDFTAAQSARVDLEREVEVLRFCLAGSETMCPA